jgi:hypothetical protein
MGSFVREAGTLPGSGLVQVHVLPSERASEARQRIQNATRPSGTRFDDLLAKDRWHVCLRRDDRSLINHDYEAFADFILANEHMLMSRDGSALTMWRCLNDASGMSKQCVYAPLSLPWLAEECGSQPSTSIELDQLAAGDFGSGGCRAGGRRLDPP